MSTTYANPTNPCIAACPSAPVTLTFNANVTISGGDELFELYAKIKSGAPVVALSKPTTPVATSAPAQIAPPPSVFIKEPVRTTMVGSWADDAEAAANAAAEAAKTPKNWNDVAKKGITLPALVQSKETSQHPKAHPARSKDVPTVCHVDNCWPPTTKKIGRALFNEVDPKILEKHGVVIPPRITTRGLHACGDFHPVKDVDGHYSDPDTTRLCTNGGASGPDRCTKAGCKYSHVPGPIYRTWRWLSNPKADADARAFWGKDTHLIESVLADNGLFTWSLPEDAEPVAPAPPAPTAAAAVANDVSAAAPIEAPPKVYKPRAVRVPKDGTWSNPAIVVEDAAKAADEPIVELVVDIDEQAVVDAVATATAAATVKADRTKSRPNGHKRGAVANKAAGKSATPARIISPMTKAGLDDLDVAAEARMVA